MLTICGAETVERDGDFGLAWATKSEMVSKRTRRKGRTVKLVTPSRASSV
jgi:hypothetical protein